MFLVGINLLREGSICRGVLVAILDADKRVFCARVFSIQTIGRGCRNVNGTPLLYADRMGIDERAVEETRRRPGCAAEFNVKNGKNEDNN